MTRKHLSAWAPSFMLMNVFVSVVGSIIGLELIARLGIMHMCMLMHKTNVMCIRFQAKASA